MPATAGRVPMPKGNRLDTSASLRTTGIWANTIGYDPYAPTNAEPAAAAAGENVYEKSKGLLAMARLSGGVEVDTDRGMWKGHGRLKGFHAPPSGLDAAAAGAGTAGAGAAALAAPSDDEDESDSDLSDSESEERRRKKAAKKAKKAKKHKKHKKHKRSDSDSSADSKRRRKEKKAKKERKEKKAKKSSDSSE